MNLIWGFSRVRLAPFEVQTSVFHGGAAGASRERQGVGAVCTWGPAGYNTPVELPDRLTVSHWASAQRAHVQADGYPVFPWTQQASDIHERQFCGFPGFPYRSCHLFLQHDSSKRGFFFPLTTVTAPRNKNFLQQKLPEWWILKTFYAVEWLCRLQATTRGE